ncbi:hypothetical protein C8034_v002503 [Colletotrichum sidae]|uniref:Alpha/beta hydrolase fold-3 domain-containing protein n=1 Tax=Colletotrichum sidae TaxID=1347389 RepID=A0A4R8TR49_9PEZI|nr:hypothetical protein C8034_v002503 [Colletotrichum sidae]
MQRWATRWLPCPSRRVHRRCFHHDSSIDTVEVSCASSGSITVDLHNVFRHSASTPLLIYVPPVSPTPGSQPSIPRFLRPHPTAVINYRWFSPDSIRPESGPEEEEEHDFSTPLQWPTPIHDVLSGYGWITKNLRPEGNSRRDLYVYSSHAGASLATSLALTETHQHEPVAVRGLVAWNGIYNWSMFLPDHKINKTARGKSRKPSPRPEDGSTLRFLEREMTGLFRKPADLFDHFASPSLFFQTSGMNVPPTFTQAADLTALIDRLSSMTSEHDPSRLLDATGIVLPTPRRSALKFPPSKSTLKLPASLLLHDAPAEPVTKRKTKRKLRVAGHTFEAQAQELAELMRRSLEKLEFKQRMQWDEEFDVRDAIARRVSVVDVGENEGMELGQRGEEAIEAWLEERISS